MKDNNLQKISSFSHKINLVGLTNEEKRIITNWYCNGKHNNYSEKSKTTKNRISKKAINTFEKILYQIGIFSETTQIEIINDFINKSEYPILKNFFKFKCKDSEGENVIVGLHAGGGYDEVPTINIITKDECYVYEIPFVYFNFFQQSKPVIKKTDDKFTEKIKEEARETYNKNFISKEEIFKPQEKVNIRVPKNSKPENINNQEIEMEKENTSKKLK